MRTLIYYKNSKTKFWIQLNQLGFSDHKQDPGIERQFLFFLIQHYKNNINLMFFAHFILSAVESLLNTLAICFSHSFSDTMTWKTLQRIGNWTVNTVFSLDCWNVLCNTHSGCFQAEAGAAKPSRLYTWNLPVLYVWYIYV